MSSQVLAILFVSPHHFVPKVVCHPEVAALVAVMVFQMIDFEGFEPTDLNLWSKVTIVMNAVISNQSRQ